MRALAAAVLAAGWLGSLAGLPLPWPHLPTAVERWLYNPRERTGRAIEAYDKGEARRSARLADTAGRLAPEDPRVEFAAGTTHLAAGDSRQAAKLLEGAAAAAPPDLAPAAWYNLGNARLASRDPAGAVEAYQKTLLAEPGNADAKFNLELALSERDRQRAGGAGAPREGSRGNQGGNQSSGRPEGDRQSEQERGRGDEEGRGSTNPGEGRQGSAGEQGQGRPQAGRRGSMRFEDQPDMSAAEATALLQSVENLERQQRRAEAARRGRRRAAGEKDW